MGLRGPAKKPSALEAAEGNRGKRPVNSNEPKPPAGVPEMPRGLPAGARRIWEETVEIMLTVPGLLTVADGSALFDYCQVRFEKLVLESAIRAEQSEAVKKQLLLKEPDRLPAIAVRANVYSASAKLLNTLRHRENVLRRELGLSPSARSSMRLTSQKPEKSDPLKAALFARPRLVAV